MAHTVPELRVSRYACPKNEEQVFVFFFANTVIQIILKGEEIMLLSHRPFTEILEVLQSDAKYNISDVIIFHAMCAIVS